MYIKEELLLKSLAVVQFLHSSVIAARSSFIFGLLLSNTMPSLCFHIIQQIRLTAVASSFLSLPAICRSVHHSANLESTVGVHCTLFQVSKMLTQTSLAKEQMVDSFRFLFAERASLRVIHTVPLKSVSTPAP